MYVPPLPENALQIDTYSRYALFLPVWLCCFIYDSMVWSVCFCRYGLVMLSSPRTLLLSFPFLNHPTSHLFPLFMRFLEWLVTSFSSSFFLSIYLCYLLRWWCIMIVFKMTSIRCNAHIRCHFRSYKTSYKPIFLYISYMIYIGTFEV